MNDRLKTVADCLAGYKDADGNAVLGGTSAGANFDGEISRAQFAAILVRLAVIDGETKPAAPSEATFADVPTTNALFAEVEAAVALGLFDGTSQVDEESGKNLFLPGGNITFAQVVKALHNYMVAQGEDLTDDGNGADTGLDCKAFDAELTALEGRGILSASSTLPADCIAPATRGQAFDALAGVNSYQVAVDPARENPFPVPTNATFNVTGGGVEKTWVANTDSDASDDVQLTVTNAADGEIHRYALVKASAVTEVDGQFMFTDDPDNDVADLMLADADITVVNGAPAPAVPEVTPVNGQITLTIDGDDTNESVRLVVWFDADSGDDLDLGDDDKPVAGEIFGVSDVITFVPPAAGSAASTGTLLIKSVDKDAMTFTTDAAIYSFDSNDVFFIDGNGTDDGATAFGEQVTIDQFLAEISAGDSIESGSQYNANPQFASSFSLLDNAPGVVDILGVAAKDTTAVLTLDASDIADGATVTAKVVADGGAFDDAAITTVTATEDADSTETEFQLNISGLTPDTDYEVFVFQTVDGENSLTDDAALNTVPTIDTPTITDTVLTTDQVVEGLADAGDVYTITFNEGMAAIVDGDFLDFVDADGDTFRIVCDNGGTIAALATQGEATCVLSDEDTTAGTETLTLAITTTPTDRNAAGDDDLEYPATITATSGITDADDNVKADLSASADVVVDTE